MADKFYKKIAENRRARHYYQILETYSAGIILSGTEIKSVRSARVNLEDSFVKPIKGELWVINLHIAPYQQGSRYNADPLRDRKLLLKKSELKKLVGKISQKGLTAVPLKLYLQGNWAKVEIALAKAKKTFEKKDRIKDRDIQREVDRTLKERR